MSEGTLQVAAGQTGDRVRTARKTNPSSQEVHEQYVINDVPWQVAGSYFANVRGLGIAGSDSTGVLAALLRPSAAVYDIIVRRVGFTYFNEGTANPNYIGLARTTVLPAANTPITTAGKKSTADPNCSAHIFSKPTGLSLSSDELSRRMNYWTKPSTASATGEKVVDFTDEEEPLILKGGQALALLQDNAGTTTEWFSATFEWLEVTL